MGNSYRGDVPAQENSYFSAQYAMSLDERVHPVMFNLDNGRFYPEFPVKVREMVHIVFQQLNSSLNGSGTFADVPTSDSCYQEAALLKDLGIISGERLNPDCTMTQMEFYQMLSTLFPESRLTDVPRSDESLTRRTAAVTLCRLLNRSGDSRDRKELAGNLQDIDMASSDFWMIAEACIPHEFVYSDGAEEWTSSAPAMKTENGYYFVGSSLHYLDEEGETLKNKSIGRISFDSDGAWTSGDPELDVMVKDVLNSTVNPQRQSRMEMLRILYDHVRDDYEYCYGDNYEPGQTGWANQEAKKMLQKKIGNCYRFAGLFAVLARAIGFDAEECCGVLDKDIYFHSWVEIPIDGEQRLFDPQHEDKLRRDGISCDLFNGGADVLEHYNAMREYRKKES